MPKTHLESHEAIARVREVLARTLDRRRRELARIAPEGTALVDQLEQFVTGGKMLRPLFCRWGGESVARCSEEVQQTLALLGASIELVQAAALIHDDVMDHSPTRRGRPTIHVAQTAAHRRQGLLGDAHEHGTAVAIILGDLALTWAGDLGEQALRTAPVPTPWIDRARDELDALRTEVMAGQYLDVLHQAGGLRSIDDAEAAARAVIRWKTVPYTVERPLRLGAALCGADDAHLAALSALALEVGTAFQLRDDLLGALGDEDRTGKSATSDISENKRTVLLARALRDADPTSRADLDAALGSTDATAVTLAAAQDALRRSGAAASVGADVRAGRDRALALLSAADVTDAAAAALADLIREAMDLSGLALEG